MAVTSPPPATKMSSCAATFASIPGCSGVRRSTSARARAGARAEERGRAHAGRARPSGRTGAAGRLSLERRRGTSAAFGFLSSKACRPSRTSSARTLPTRRCRCGVLLSLNAEAAIARAISAKRDCDEGELLPLRRWGRAHRCSQPKKPAKAEPSGE